MGGADSEAASQERVLQIVERSDHYVPVALAGAELVGYAWAQDYGPHLRGGAHTARLHDLYVVPEWRRRGIGRQLFEAVRIWAAGHAIRWLQWQASTAAVPFYARLGLVGDTRSDLQERPFYEIDFARGSASEAAGDSRDGPDVRTLHATIRRAHERDLAAVATLYRQWEAEGITWGLVAATEADLRARLGPFFLVAERAEGDQGPARDAIVGIVGFAIGQGRRATPAPPDNLAVFPGGADYLEVEDVYVAPHARGRGIGTQLMQTLLEQAHRSGIDRSMVFSATKNTDQITRFYQRLGYRPWGVQSFR